MFKDLNDGGKYRQVFYKLHRNTDTSQFSSSLHRSICVESILGQSHIFSSSLSLAFGPDVPKETHIQKSSFFTKNISDDLISDIQSHLLKYANYSNSNEMVLLSRLTMECLMISNHLSEEIYSGYYLSQYNSHYSHAINKNLNSQYTIKRFLIDLFNQKNYSEISEKEIIEVLNSLISSSISLICSVLSADMSFKVSDRYGHPEFLDILEEILSAYLSGQFYLSEHSEESLTLLFNEILDMAKNSRLLELPKTNITIPVLKQFEKDCIYQLNHHSDNPEEVYRLLLQEISSLKKEGEQNNSLGLKDKRDQLLSEIVEVELFLRSLYAHPNKDQAIKHLQAMLNLYESEREAIVSESIKTYIENNKEEILLFPCFPGELQCELSSVESLIDDLSGEYCSSWDEQLLLTSFILNYLPIPISLSEQEKKSYRDTQAKSYLMRVICSMSYIGVNIEEDDLPKLERVIDTDNMLDEEYINLLLEHSRTVIVQKNKEQPGGFFSSISRYLFSSYEQSSILVTDTEKVVLLIRIYQLLMDMQGLYDTKLCFDRSFLESGSVYFNDLQVLWQGIQGLCTEYIGNSSSEVQEELKQALLCAMNMSLRSHCIGISPDNEKKIVYFFEAAEKFCCDHTLEKSIDFYQNLVFLFKNLSNNQHIIEILEHQANKFDLSIMDPSELDASKTIIAQFSEKITRFLYIVNILNSVVDPFIPAIKSYQSRRLNISSLDTRLAIYDETTRNEAIKDYVESHLREVFVYYQDSFGELKDDISINISQNSSWYQIVSDLMRVKYWLMSPNALCLGNNPELKHISISFSSSNQKNHCPDTLLIKLEKIFDYVDKLLTIPGAFASEVSIKKENKEEEEELNRTPSIEDTSDLNIAKETISNQYIEIEKNIRERKKLDDQEDKSKRYSKKRSKQRHRSRRDTKTISIKKRSGEFPIDTPDHNTLALLHLFKQDSGHPLYLSRMKKITQIAIEYGIHHPSFIREYDKYMDDWIGRRPDKSIIVYGPAEEQKEIFSRRNTALYSDQPEFQSKYKEVFSKPLNAKNYPVMEDLKKLGFTSRMLDPIFDNQRAVQYAIELCESVNLLSGKEIFKSSDIFAARVHFLARERADLYRNIDIDIDFLMGVWKDSLSSRVPKHILKKYQAKSFSQNKMMNSRLYISKETTRGHCLALSSMGAYTIHKNGPEGLLAFTETLSRMEAKVQSLANPMYLDETMPILRDFNKVFNDFNTEGSLLPYDPILGVKKDFIAKLSFVEPDVSYFLRFNNHATLFYIDTKTIGKHHPIYLLYDPNLGLYPCFDKSQLSDVWTQFRYLYPEVHPPAGKMWSDFKENRFRIDKISDDLYRRPIVVYGKDGKRKTSNLAKTVDNLEEMTTPIPRAKAKNLDDLMTKWRQDAPKIKKSEKFRNTVTNFLKRKQKNIPPTGAIADNMNDNVQLLRYTKILEEEVIYDLRRRGTDTDDVLIKIEHFFNEAGSQFKPIPEKPGSKMNLDVEVPADSIGASKFRIDEEGIPRVQIEIEVDAGKFRNFVNAVKGRFHKNNIKQVFDGVGKAGIALLPFIALLQISSIKEKLKSDNKLDNVSGRVEAAILSADIAVGLAQTATMVSTSLPKITSAAKALNLARYAGNVGKYLGPAGAGLGVLSGGAEVAVGAYRMSTAQNDYEYEVGTLEVAHGSVTVILSVMMAIPCPPCQAAAISAQLITELIFYYLKAELEQKLEDYNNRRDMCRYEKLMQEVLASVKTLITETEKTYNLNIPLAVSSVTIEGSNLKIQLSSNAMTTDISTSVNNERCTAKFGAFSVVNCLKESRTLPENLSFSNDHYDPRNIIILPSTPTVHFSLRESIAHTTEIQAWGFGGLSKLQQCRNEQYFNRKTPGASAEGCDVMEKPVLRYKYYGSNSKKSPVTESVMSTRPGPMHTTIQEKVIRYSLPNKVKLGSQNTTINLGSGSAQALFGIPAGLEKPMMVYGSSQYPVANGDTFYPKPHYLFQSQENHSAVSVLLNPGATVDFSGVQGSKVISLFESSPGSIYKVEFISKKVCRIYMHAINKHPGGDQPIEKTDDSTTAAYWWIPGHPICDQDHNPNEPVKANNKQAADPILIEYTDIDIGSFVNTEVYLILLRDRESGPKLMREIPVTILKLQFDQKNLYVASLGDETPDPLISLGYTSYFINSLIQHIGSVDFYIDENTLVAASSCYEEEDVSIRGFIRKNPHHENSNIIIPFVCKKSVLEEKGKEYIDSFLLVKMVLVEDPNFESVSQSLHIETKLRVGLFLFYSEYEKRMVWQVDDLGVSLENFIECTTTLQEKTLKNGQVDYSCNDIYTFDDQSPVEADRIHLIEEKSVTDQEDWLRHTIHRSKQHAFKITESVRDRRSARNELELISQDLFEITHVPTKEGPLKSTLYHNRAYLRPHTDHEESVIAFFKVSDILLAIIAEKIPEQTIPEETELPYTTTISSIIGIHTTGTPITEMSTDESTTYNKHSKRIKTIPEHIKLSLLPPYPHDLLGFEKAVYEKTLTHADIPNKKSWLEDFTIEAYEVSPENQSIVVKTYQGLILQCFIDPEISESGIKLNAVTDTWFRSQGIYSTDIVKASSFIQVLLSQYALDPNQRFLPAHLTKNPIVKREVPFYVRDGYQRTIWRDLQLGKEMVLDWSESKETMGLGPRDQRIIGYTYDEESNVLSATVQVAEMNKLFLLSRHVETGVLSIIESLDCADSVILEEDGNIIFTCLLAKIQPADPARVIFPPYNGIDTVHFIPASLAFEETEVFLEPKTVVGLKKIILGKPNNALQRPQKVAIPSAPEDEALGMPRIMVSLGEKNDSLSLAESDLYDVSVALLLPKDESIGQFQYAYLTLPGAYEDGQIDHLFENIMIRYGDFDIDYQYINDRLSVLSKSEYCSLGFVQQCESVDVSKAQVLDV